MVGIIPEFADGLGLLYWDDLDGRAVGMLVGQTLLKVGREVGSEVASRRKFPFSTTSAVSEFTISVGKD